MYSNYLHYLYCFHSHGDVVFVRSGILQVTGILTTLRVIVIYFMYIFTMDAYKECYGCTTLSNYLNFPRSTIHSIIEKYNETRFFENVLRAGRKLLISERIERKILRVDSKNYHITTKYIVSYVKISGLNVSRKTVTKCFHRTGLQTYRSW